MQNKNEYDLLLSSISHEIRNPVTLINSYLQLVASLHPEVEHFEYWENITQEMKHLKYLLADLSAFNNGMCINPVPTDLPCWMNSYYETASSLVQSITNAELCLDISPVLPVLSLDQDKFRQVLDNLIRNAAEAIAVHPDPALHGIIRISAQYQEKTFIITVTDNGCGIPAEDLPRLFEPFFSHKLDGTGLGLTLSDRIIKAHHGTITVHSEPYKSTEFIIRLPAVI